jgi:membrane-associated phospholipid phosphatase
MKTPSLTGLRARTRACATSLLLFVVFLPTVTYAGAAAPPKDPAAATQSPTPPKASHRMSLSRRAWWRQGWVLPTAGLVGFLAAMRIHEGPSHGPFGIDYRLKQQDNNGIMSRSNQLGLEYGTVAFEAAGALLLGNHNRLGHVFWQAADSSVFAGLAAQVLKYSFRRARPVQGQGPNAWFQGRDQSFPSGEVTLQASFVTPFILDYRHRYPWIWAAELLPVYDAYGRMKSQGHWQSDVLAGWLLGTGFGYWATRRKIPLLVEILPGGASVGFYKRF